MEMYITDNSKTEEEMALLFKSLKTVNITMDIIETTCSTEKDSTTGTALSTFQAHFKPESKLRGLGWAKTNILVRSKAISGMESALIHIQTEGNMRENGLWEKDMDQES